MSPTSAKVLIADDEPQIRSLCQRFLARHGYESVQGADGIEALEAVAQSRPDIVLLDVMMPRLDGLEVCRRLKADRETASIPIILLTGMNNPEDIVNGLQAGADDYVCKPVRLPELRVRMEKLIRRKQTFDVLQSMNEGLLRDLGDKSQILAELFSLTLEMNRCPTLEDVLGVLTKSISKMMRSQKVLIALPDNKRQNFKVANAIGLPHEAVDSWAVALTPAIANALVENYAPRQVRAQDASSTLASLGQSLPLFNRSTVVAPMVVEHEPVGFVALMDYHEETLSLDDAMTLSYITQAASVAIKNRLRQIEIRQTQDVTIFALAHLAESRDRVTGNHLRRVQTYCKMLADHISKHSRELSREMAPDFVDEIWRAAPLHDIGKVGISDSILLKPDKLDPAEIRMMEQHTIIGGQTLEFAEQWMPQSSFLTMAKELCYCHHEKWDGSGYPRGLAGREIPLSARILAIADVYDALTTLRPYKRPFSHEEACVIINDGRGNHFDPNVCDAFNAIANEFDRIRMGLADSEMDADSYFRDVLTRQREKVS